MTPERLYQLNARLDIIEAQISKAQLIVQHTEDPYREWYAAGRREYINKLADEAAQIYKQLKAL